MSRIFYLPAAKIKSAEELEEQLAIEQEKQPGVTLIVLLCGVFVIGLMLAIVAGLSYAHWKDMIF